MKKYNILLNICIKISIKFEKSPKLFINPVEIKSVYHTLYAFIIKDINYSKNYREI